MRRGLILAALAFCAPALGGSVPYPVYTAVHGRVIGWQRFERGFAVVYIRGPARGWCGLDGGSWHLALVERGAPPRLTADRRLSGSMCGNELVWLRAGRLTDGRHKEVAVSILTTPSIGSSAWVVRRERDRFRLVRRFFADRIAIGPGWVKLRWITRERSPVGARVEIWRFERGRYRLAKREQ